MLVLVTGSSSAFGRKLVSELINNGRYLIRLLEHKTLVEQQGCEVYKGDVTDLSSMMDACAGVDVVIHMAGLSYSHRQKAYFEVNEGGTKNVVTACEKQSVDRLIHISSGGATVKSGAYGVSKLRGEDLVRGCELLRWVILRPSEIYGPEMNEGIGQLLAWIDKYPWIPIIGDGSYLLSPVYVDDVTNAIVRILKKKDLNEEILNLCGPEQITFTELVDRVAQAYKVRRRKVFVPIWSVKIGVYILTIAKTKFVFLDQIPRLINNKSQSLDKTREIISYSPRTIEEGLHALQSTNS